MRGLRRVDRVTTGERRRLKYVYTRRSAVVQSLGPRPSLMTRMPAFLLAALLAAAPLSATAQDRGERDGGERGRPSAESQEERPRISVGAAVQRASAGRPGRFAALRRFAEYARSHSDVWFCRRLDIARHWRAVHPFGAGND